MAVVATNLIYELSRVCLVVIHVVTRRFIVVAVLMRAGEESFDVFYEEAGFSVKEVHTSIHL